MQSRCPACHASRQIRIAAVLFRLFMVLAVCAGAIPAAAQAPSSIDFERDVQPIFRERCISCHGGGQQFGAFRLDRRADAMRGGSQTNIGPGNADGSRLYHRLAGTSLGPQMPPDAPLSAEQIAIVRQWIDEGAVWPDAVAGDVAPPPVDDDATRLIASIREGDRPAVDDILRRSQTVVMRRGRGGGTPLMAAALYGDTALVGRLLGAGAPPDDRNAAGATALMWAVPNVAKMRLLLDAGADVNARSDDGRTALIVASGIVGAAPALRQLLEYGADASMLQSSDVSPLREAARVGDVDNFRVLMDYGVSAKGAGGAAAAFLRTNCFKCAQLAGVGGGGPLRKQPAESAAASTAPRYDPGRSARPTPIGDTPPTPAAVRAAVERSLPLLQDVGVSFIAQTGCASCHHNSVVSMAVAAARANGFAVNEAAATKQTHAVAAYLDAWRERALQNATISGAVDTTSYLLFGLAADRHPPNAATDAQAMLLARRQAADGHWAFSAMRPPIESNDMTVTALSLRALQVFAPPPLRADYDAAIQRARAWLTTAPADATEERAFRLLGLSWAGAPKELLQSAAAALVASQGSDGGWAQVRGMGSDAYATGQALVALRESGSVAAADRAYRAALAFLLRTQIADGSWPVESQAVPIQAYFESGFPYGVNQWVSAAATAWATTALALAR